MSPAAQFVIADDVIGLRWFGLADVDAVTEACQDSEISRWTATVPYPYARADASAWISGHDAARSTGSGFSFAVIDLASSALLGSISVVCPSAAEGVVGYWVAAPARRRGIATRALALVEHWAFDALPVEVLRLDTMNGNVASERVAVNNDFAPVDTDARHVDAASGRVFAVTRWEKRRG